MLSVCGWALMDLCSQRDWEIHFIVLTPQKFYFLPGRLGLSCSVSENPPGSLGLSALPPATLPIFAGIVQVRSPGRGLSA